MKPNAPPEWVFHWLMPLIFMSLGVVLPIAIVIGSRRKRRIRQSWSCGQGRVIALKRESRGDDDTGRDYRAQCIYRTWEEEVFTGWDSESSRHLIGPVGSIVNLWYDPAAPAEFTIVPLGDDLGARLLVCIIVGPAFFTVGLIFFFLTYPG